MDVENAAVAIRPRNHWQAMDLGFRMARHWFLPLWLLWAAGAIPLCLLLGLLFFKHWGAILVVVWWCKPVFELPLLYFLSRAIFAQPPSLRSTLANYFQIVRHLALPLLTWRRFSLARSFENPAMMLEGLSGQARRDRLRILKEQVGEKCQWMTFACCHFELLLYLSLVTTGIYLIPAEQDAPPLLGVLAQDSPAAAFANFIAYTIAMSVVGPFYTAAGFGVYLSRRTRLEAWDIELGFKQLANRLATSRPWRGLAVAVLCLTVVGFPAASRAETPANVRAAIQAVAADKDFGKLETHYRWRKKTSSDEPSAEPGFLEGILKALGNVFEWLGQFVDRAATPLEALLWFALIVIILLLVRKFEPWRRWQALRRPGTTGERRRPAKVAGLDLEDASLSGDVMAEVRRLLLRSETRAALSLLYRGTLLRLINRYDLTIAESSTEGECMRLVRKACPAGEADYFRQLTQCWCRLAYAHEPPARQQLNALGSQWTQFYESTDG